MHGEVKVYHGGAAGARVYLEADCAGAVGVHVVPGSRCRSAVYLHPAVHLPHDLQ